MDNGLQRRSGPGVGEDDRAQGAAIDLRRVIAVGARPAQHTRTEPLDDLVQVASVGLVKAVDRWDPDRGLAFSSYAVPTILGELRRYFRDATWDVRPARDLQELCLSVEEARDALWGELGRSPTVGDMAGRLDRSEEEVVEALQATEGRSVRSLDAPVKLLGLSWRQWVALLAGGVPLVALAHWLAVPTKPAISVCTVLIGVPLALAYLSEESGYGFGQAIAEDAVG